MIYTITAAISSVDTCCQQLTVSTKNSRQQAVISSVVITYLEKRALLFYFDNARADASMARARSCFLLLLVVAVVDALLPCDHLSAKYGLDFSRLGKCHCAGIERWSSDARLGWLLVRLDVQCARLNTSEVYASLRESFPFPVPERAHIRLLSLELDLTFRQIESDSEWNAIFGLDLSERPEQGWPLSLTTSDAVRLENCQVNIHQEAPLRFGTLFYSTNTSVQFERLRGVGVDRWPVFV